MHSATPSAEIEATLQASPDRIRGLVATCRVGIFACTVALTVAMELLFHPGGGWVPAAYFVTLLGLAIALRAVVRHRPATPALRLAALAADLTGGIGILWLMQALGDPSGQGDRFLAWVGAPALMLVLALNLLRNDRRAAVFGAVLGVGLLGASVAGIDRFDAPALAGCALVAMTALVGWLGAGEARRTLDHHARTRLLTRYVPHAQVARVLDEDPDAAMALGGRTAEVTVMATDLRGFTARSATMTPDAVIAELNAYHGVCYAEIERHGGMLDKFMGDGQLVVFGLAREGVAASDGGATAAVACARALRVALAAHNRERVAGGREPLAMGVGIHTGEVVAGNLGAPGRRLEFTVIGDTVNTAARLEGATKEHGVPVLVSGATVVRLADRTGLRELGPVTLRGKTRALGVWALADDGPAATP